MGIHDLLNKMETAETGFLETEFLAPVLPGGKVRIRIAGVVCELDVKDNSGHGWAILKPQFMETRVGEYRKKQKHPQGRK